MCVLLSVYVSVHSVIYSSAAPDVSLGACLGSSCSLRLSAAVGGQVTRALMQKIRPRRQAVCTKILIHKEGESERFDEV